MIRIIGTPLLAIALLMVYSKAIEFKNTEEAISERVTKGVTGGPSGPSWEGPGVGHKISVGH